MIYLLGIIPLVFSFLAIKSNKYFIKASVTGSIIIIVLIYMLLNQVEPSFFIIIGALTFSIIGDSFLSNKDQHEHYFVFGVSIYFLAHVCYLIYMVVNGSMNLTVLLLLLVGFGLYFIIRVIKVLKDKILLLAVTVYLLISCFTFAASFNLTISMLPKILLISAIGLILFSDTMIAETDFMLNKKVAFLILPTYYLAHISILYSVFFL